MNFFHFPTLKRISIQKPVTSITCDVVRLDPFGPRDEKDKN